MPTDQFHNVILLCRRHFPWVGRISPDELSRPCLFRAFSFGQRIQRVPNDFTVRIVAVAPKPIELGHGPLQQRHFFLFSLA